ncbi:RnfABCDGE type electron transport complex subunit B [Neisseria perflava]|uniref:RnfABCDGE type electron transport complex subunit B n=1 Tax=Neisseria perflava TaxID=33053 RepID=UPI00209DCCC8|nr:RnfABCDGE type electron transport complex subunit B [Neisseria perflava]MCP1659898.1 electron transport complex protein RnfB [Neisseria perflava]MCP1772255.1 electron transport complex protein RnfB [Neisseria perflava]
MPITAECLNDLLPQTQCRECGYEGCLPYAEALSGGEADINLCAPGGETVIKDIASILGKVPVPPAKIIEKALAWIDESVCIGCTACIRACPVDAIFGAHKLMHTVIRSECTGCGLCVAPCPIDCIHMQPIQAEFLPLTYSISDENKKNHPRFAAATHAKQRYEWHNYRNIRDVKEKKEELAKRENATKNKLSATQKAISSQPTESSTPFNPMDLISKAMAKAQSQQTNLVTAANRENFRNKQIEEAKQRAIHRRAQRDAKYGNEEEKEAALVYLRQYKAEQEAIKIKRKHT